MARSKTSNFFVWIILGLLFVGLMGFGATGLSGTIRSIGSVGDKDIPVREYVTALRGEMAAFQAQTGTPLTVAGAQALQLDRVALARVTTATALANEANSMGVSAGDARVRAELVSNPSFRGPGGSFDREEYRRTLQDNGITVSDYESGVRDNLATAILQNAVANGTIASETYTAGLSGFIGEMRRLTWARIDTLDTPLPEPTETELETFHGENPELFTTPETRVITYIRLTPDMLVETVEIDEEALRDLYDTRIDEFVQAERRLVERLVFATEDEASAAMARIESAETGFEDEVAARGIDLADVDLGDIVEADLGAAGPAVFAASPGTVVGPLESLLGPALYRVNAILTAQETTFEEARAELREELATERARRVIADAEGGIDDLLIGGAELEEIAAETEAELGTINWHPAVTEGIAAYDEFGPVAAALEVGDFPEITRLEDGGIFAARLDELIPATLQPFDEVRDQVIVAWEARETRDALLAQAEAIAAAAGAGDSLDSLGLTPTTEAPLDRQGFVPGLPETVIATLFEMTEGELRVLPADGAAVLLRLDAVIPADDTDPETVQRRDLISEQAAQGLSQDLLEYYSRALLTRTPPQIDLQAVNAVNSSFQ